MSFSSSQNIQPAMTATHILVVEDSPIQCEMLRRLLVGQAYTCELAADGAAGLAALRTTAVDLVISDITMPVLDGYQMCTAIKQDRALKHIPVILLTALSNPVDVIRGLNAGAEAYLTKPYDQERLLRQVRHLLAAAPLPDTVEPPVEPIHIDISGQLHAVTADRRQILHMLVSTYDNAVEQNRILRKMEEDLRQFNQTLESRVKERTAALELEQARAHDAELRYRTLFALLPEGVVLMTPDSCSFIEANDVACNQLGYSQQEFAGLDLHQITAGHARAALAAHLQQAQLVYAYNFTSTHLTKKGEPRDMEIRTSFIELGGQRLLHCILRDITELKHAREMELALQQNAARIDELNREILAMESLSKRPVDVSKITPETVNALVTNLTDRYSKLLDLSVEHQAYQMQPDISGALRAIADELGSVGAGPLEVVALHSQALRIKVDGLKPELKWAFMEEGRLMVLQLMGYLATYYRKVLQ
jgi:PAS domain S-box-containing protein